MSGGDAFADDVRSIRTARADYTCHPVGAFRGHAPTESSIAWESAALFGLRGERVATLWVLGDLAGLDAALQANQR